MPSEHQERLIEAICQYVNNQIRHKEQMAEPIHRLDSMSDFQLL